MKERVTQTFQLSVALEFRPRKMDWTLYKATISGWDNEHRSGAKLRAYFKKKEPEARVALRLCPQSCEDDEALFTTVSLNELPRDLANRCSKLVPSNPMPVWEKRVSFPILLALSPGLPGEEFADPYEMRREFFGLSDDVDQLTEFAHKWGLWDSNKLAIFPNERIAMLEQREIPCIFPHLIKQKQKKYSDALCGAPEQWLSHSERRILIVQQRRKPYFVVKTDLSDALESCPDAIAVTITLDRLNSSEYRKCSRPDCPMRFEVTSEHERKYCSRACAHVMAVRASRKRAKAGGGHIHKGKGR